MLTVSKGRKPRRTKRQITGPVKLRTRQEASDYLAKHVKPVGHSPNGRPIYNYDDLKRLDIQYPDQKD